MVVHDSMLFDTTAVRGSVRGKKGVFSRLFTEACGERISVRGMVRGKKKGLQAVSL
jgi:hypothetical protein